ncbi:MAG: hypothetical protein C4297_07190 [Gemmataceae bacterium]
MHSGAWACLKCPDKHRRRCSRPAYTLLEVILAIAIGLLLVAALYVAVDVQFRYIQTGQEVVADSHIARGVLHRLSTDLQRTLAPPVGSGAGSVSASSSATGSASAASASGSGATNGSGETSGASDGSAGTGAATQLNFGLLGDNVQMLLFLTATPRAALLDPDAQHGLCDLRQVSYFLVPGQGLARQEWRQVLSSELANDPVPEIVAQEVQEVQFRYYDAAAGTWTDSWDSTVSGLPAAIEVVVGIASVSRSIRLSGALRYYRQVIALPAAGAADQSSSAP